MTGEMNGEDSDDGVVAPRVGGGGGGSCDPSAGSADGYACRLDGARARGGRGARVGLVRELPPQRGGRNVAPYYHLPLPSDGGNGTEWPSLPATERD